MFYWYFCSDGLDNIYKAQKRVSNIVRHLQSVRYLGNGRIVTSKQTTSDNSAAVRNFLKQKKDNLSKEFTQCMNTSSSSILEIQWAYRRTSGLHVHLAARAQEADGASNLHFPSFQFTSII